MNGFTIHTKQSSEMFYRAIATSSTRTIKNIVGLNEKEAITKAKLAILQFLISTSKEPLLLLQDDCLIVGKNYAAQQLIEDNTLLAIGEYCLCPIETHYIPQKILIVQIEDR